MIDYNKMDYKRYRLIEKLARGECKAIAYECVREGICYELESWHSLWVTYKDVYMENADKLLKSMGR